MALTENIAIFRSLSANVRPGLLTRLAVWKTRRELARLDADALNDIGVSPSEATKEAARSFWDVPATWTSRQ